MGFWGASLSNFGNKRGDEYGLTSTSSPNSAMVGIFILASLACGYGLYWLLGEFLPTYIIVISTLIMSSAISAFAFSWVTKKEKEAIEKQSSKNIGAAAKFEEREIEARRARAAKDRKTYK